MNRVESLATLRSQLSGDLLAPGDDGYDAARSVWNGMIDRRPFAVCRCQSVEDVIASVRYAGQQGLPVSIRGGGHNVAGHAVCDGGLMIDLSLMRGVRVNPDTRSASVQGGAPSGAMSTLPLRRMGWRPREV